MAQERRSREPPSTAQNNASAPPCSGVVAVRRFTDLCDRAQAADKRGETATALSLYRELLQLRERLQSGRGPLLQTLFAVAQKVERRVAELDGSTCSSAPTTGRSSSHSQEMVVIRPPTTAESLSRPASAAAVVQPPRALTSGPRDTAAPSRRASEAQPPHESQWAVQQQPPATRTSTPESEVEHVMRSSWPASGKAPARSTPNLGANSSHGQGETSSDDERPAPPKPSFGRHGPMPPGPTTRARPAQCALDRSPRGRRCELACWSVSVRLPSSRRLDRACWTIGSEAHSSSDWLRQSWRRASGQRDSEPAFGASFFFSSFKFS